MLAVRAHPMRSRTPTTVVLLALVATITGVALSPSSVHAEGSTTVQLELVAPAQCGGKQALEQRIQARLRSSSSAMPGTWKARVEIVLHDSAPMVTGSLELDAPREGRLVREVGGGDCTEVLDALALITALAIDGGVVVPAISAIPWASTSAPPSTAPASSASSGPSATVTAATSAAPANTNAPDTTRHAVDRRWRWNVGIHGGVMGAIAPTLGPDGGVFVEALSPSSLGGLLRFTFQQARPATVHTPDGDASFVATTLRALGCPVRWPRLSAVSIAPCAGLEIGLLDAKGSNAPNAASLTMLWITAQLSARVGVDLSRRLALVLEGGGIVPTRHDRFYFDPSGVTAHRPPAIAPWMSLGFAARLP